MLLDPIRIQLVCNVKCDQNEVMHATRYFLKFDGDKEIVVIPQTTDDYVKQCKEIDPEKLQQLMNPKQLTPHRAEWLRRHEQLNHLPHLK